MRLLLVTMIISATVGSAGAGDSPKVTYIDL
jgi:hypothetical protein